MKKILSIIIIIFTMGGIMLLSAPKPKGLFLEYKSSTMALVIKDTALVRSEKKDVFENPMSSIPTSSTTEEKKYTLTKKELAELTSLIRDGKFFELEAFYGAPEAERNYPTKIFIKLAGKEKEVIYRSNPSYESAPGAFTKIEVYLMSLGK